jgi:hypothetical protein
MDMRSLKRDGAGGCEVALPTIFGRSAMTTVTLEDEMPIRSTTMSGMLPMARPYSAQAT